jgi:hypothetical protein
MTREDDVSYQNLLQTVRTATEALERTYLLGGLRPKEAAFRLEIDYAHFVRMFNVNDPRHFPPEQIEQLMRVAGNTFFLDWLERKMGRIAYPLEFMALLNEIRRSLVADGKPVNFALKGLP